MIHIKLNVYCTEAFLPRYWQEQFYQQLSAMSSKAIQSAQAGLRGQARTCVSRRDRVRQLESSRKWFEISQLQIFNGKCSKVFDSKQGSCKRVQIISDFSKQITSPSLKISLSHVLATWKSRAVRTRLRGK